MRPRANGFADSPAALRVGPGAGAGPGGGAGRGDRSTQSAGSLQPLSCMFVQARAFAAAEGCDLLLAIGTTLAVYPIASMIPIAKEAGSKIVIVNGEATEMDSIADAVLRGSISEILPALLPGN